MMTYLVKRKLFLPEEGLEWNGNGNWITIEETFEAQNDEEALNKMIDGMKTSRGKFIDLELFEIIQRRVALK